MRLALQLEGAWWRVSPFNQTARRLADRHYSRQSPGDRQFMSTGKKLVLLTADESALWGVVENLDPAGGLHWRVSIFRNEGGGSLLVPRQRGNRADV